MSMDVTIRGISGFGTVLAVFLRKYDKKSQNVTMPTVLYILTRDGHPVLRFNRNRVNGEKRSNRPHIDPETYYLQRLTKIYFV